MSRHGGQPVAKRTLPKAKKRREQASKQVALASSEKITFHFIRVHARYEIRHHHYSYRQRQISSDIAVLDEAPRKTKIQRDVSNILTKIHFRKRRK